MFVLEKFAQASGVTPSRFHVTTVAFSRDTPVTFHVSRSTVAFSRGILVTFVHLRKLLQDKHIGLWKAGLCLSWRSLRRYRGFSFLGRSPPSKKPAIGIKIFMSYSNFYSGPVF